MGIRVMLFLEEKSQRKLIGFPHTTLPFFDLRYFFLKKHLNPNFYNLICQI